MTKPISIPETTLLPKYAEQARTIEKALQEQEKGTQLESGFSPYATFYFELVDKTTQMGRAVAGKGVSPQTVKAHTELSEKLCLLAARVIKAFAKVAPSELQDALRKDDADLACKILKNKDLIGKNLPNGELPLPYAIRSGSRRVVAQLFKQFPIDTSLKDRQKLTPIDHALLTKDQKMIALVLGAAIGKQDIPERALLSPVQSSDLEMIGAEKELLRRVPTANLPLLCQHAYLGELGPLNTLLATKGTDINAPAGSSGMTPLHFAALGGQTAVVEQLLKKGAKTDGLALNGKTALHLAAMNGHEAIVKLLLDRPGIQVNATDSQGKTPLHYAMILENLDTARTLVRKGADPHIETIKTTPFAILLHLSKGRSKQRDPLKFDQSTLLTAAAYGSSFGLNYAAERALPSDLSMKAANLRIISKDSNPSSKAFLVHELGELSGAAPSLFNAPGPSLIGPVASALLWGGLYSQVGLARTGLQAWQLYKIGKTSLQGLSTCWKNRHLETARPLASAGLYAFNTLSAAAELLWSLRSETSATYDARWAKIGEEVSMHRTLNSELGRQAWKDWWKTEKGAFKTASPETQRELIVTFINDFHSGKAYQNTGNCPALNADSCAQMQDKERIKCEQYVKAPEILELTGRTKQECTQNVKRLSLKCHPDKIKDNPDVCKYTQVEINAAYAALKAYGCCK